MDAAIDLSDAAKALDLSNIRFQLMYITLPLPASQGANMMPRTAG